MRIVPYRVRYRLRCWTSAVALGSAMRRLSAGGAPDRKLVTHLRYGWNNDSFAADTDYLMAVAEATRAASGPILECGSGVTTILGALSGKDLWVLDQSEEWLLKVDHLLRRYGMHANLCHAPLTNYGGFDWYTLPEYFPRQFALVICDGPPAATTRGGRYGLLPVLAAGLPGSTVLMDDTDRQDEQLILQRWSKEFPIRVVVSGPYSIFQVASDP